MSLFLLNIAIAVLLYTIVDAPGDVSDVLVIDFVDIVGEGAVVLLLADDGSSLVPDFIALSRSALQKAKGSTKNKNKNHN